jgi:hypothetical protein
MPHPWLVWILMLAFTSASTRMPRDQLAGPRSAVPLRGAIEAYHHDHKQTRSSSNIVLQLVLTTDVNGNVTGMEFGPYIRGDFPTNPVNGLSSVTFSAQMPAGPTGTTGWSYATSTGEFQANTLGVDRLGVPWFEY